MSQPTIVTPRTAARRGDDQCPWCLHDLSKEKHDNEFNSWCSNCGNPIRKCGRLSDPTRTQWVRREGVAREVTGFGSKTDQMVHIISGMKDPDKLDKILAATVAAMSNHQSRELISAKLQALLERVEADADD